VPFEIELRGVTRTYGRGEAAVPALRGVDLAVERGDLVVVKGPSGSGKTTLLNLLGGLDRASEGQVVVAGRDLGRMGDGELSRFRNRHVGYVFQAFHLEGEQTAVENVALPLVFAGIAGAERRRRAVALLERVGLAEKTDVRAANLSAGQKQRVALARALVTEPSLLLADEPTANLDTRTGREILDLLASTSRERGTTVVLVSHDVKAGAFGERLLWIEDGRLRDGPPPAVPDAEPAAAAATRAA
jgi:putative ABC transport system ATP-binding protein